MEQLHSNPIHSLNRAKFSQEYNNIIRHIGYSQFHVYYWSSVQVHAYNKYCRANYSKIFIDATGSLVKRIAYDTHTSGHIFLYEITVPDITDKKIHAVGSMLNEKHDTLTISSWLSNWIRSEAIVEISKFCPSWKKRFCV